MMSDKNPQFTSEELSPEAGIAALATPPGISALSVIRVSGAGVASVCDALFSPGPAFPRPSAMKGYTIALGWWEDGQGKRLDQVLLSAFREPYSYTGEDLYEISCHGGYATRSAILSSLFDAGIRPAEAGEFTKRAFMNGKMDLLQAEAVMDLIDAESEKQRSTALSEIDGALSRASLAFSKALYELQAEVEMLLEFPEYAEDHGGKGGQLLKKTEKLLGDLELALQSWTQGRVLSEGFHVTLCGLPNVGKSTLFNLLLGKDRSIVADLAGTTRDTVTEHAQIGGVPVCLTDTAGLWLSDDGIEREGIKRARAAAKEADLIIWLQDPEQAKASTRELKELLQFCGEGKPGILLAAKSDLNVGEDQSDALRAVCPTWNFLPWSDKDPEALKALRRAISEAYDQLGSGSETLIHNLRHRTLLQKAQHELSMAASVFREGQSLDLAAAMFRAAQEQFAEMRGEQVSDELAEQIFSRFCVGK